MPPRHVVVDGSNIATEGRSLPSLKQLDQAVREFVAENPDDRVTVVVDATFAHRIDPSELPIFEEAEVAGEVVSPPAGAVGRGDAFLLRVAEKTGATVLSNDSFQEFHAEHPWLFEADRLVGGKPVPGVGWVFVTRTPVRGPKSREVVKQARKKKAATPAAPNQTGLEMAASRAKDKKVDRAIASATQEAVSAVPAGRRRRRRSADPPSEPVNEPLAFITFIAAHPLGSEVSGVVEEFSSHGAFVGADGARCYVPLSALGEPPPRRAREVLSKGEERVFVIQALDPPRRGIELALPEFARIAGGPTAETVEEEIHPTLVDESDEPATHPLRAGGARSRKEPAKTGGPARRPAAKAPVPGAGTADGRRRSGRAPVGAPAAGPRAGAEPRPSKGAALPEKAAPKKVAAGKAGAGKAGAGKAGAGKAGAEKVGAEKAGAEKAGAGKAGAGKVEAETAGVKKAAGRREPAKKSLAKKEPAKKESAKRLPAGKPATKQAPRKEPIQQAPVKKAAPRRQPGRVAAAKTAGPTEREPATEVPAKRVEAGRAPSKKAAVAKTTGKAVPAQRATTTTKKAPPPVVPVPEPPVGKAPSRRAVRKAPSGQ